MYKKVASLPYLIWMLIFIIVPLLFVAYYAFTTPNGSFTFDNIIQVKEHIYVLFRSIWLGLVATFVCLLLGYPMGYIIANSTNSKQRTMVLLTMLPMWMNFLLRTYAWMTILENNGILNSFLELIGIGKVRIINTSGAVVLGMVYNFIPFMIMPIYSIMTKIDKRIIEAAEDLGANRVQVFYRIILPLSLPGVISGITMVFVPAVSTFVISRMLGGGELLIGDVIEMQFLGSTYNPYMGAALALVLMVLVFICMAVMNEFDDGESEAIMI
ncbi:MAG TPA: ABC transporter permease [Clostridiales bacterium]|nr:ABC transporter permease [Clostridiales bacterium]